MTAALARTGTYKPKIVWGTGTGVDTSNYDDVSHYYLNSPGLVVGALGRQQARAFSPPSAPTFDLTLTNEDGRFSPGGTLALFLGRGPATTLDCTWGADVNDNAADVPANSPDWLANGYQVKRLFDGIADQMPQSISPRGQRQLQVRALGEFAKLVDAKPIIALNESIRTDQALTLIFDACNAYVGKRVFDTGDTTLTYFFANGQQDASSLTLAVLAAEGAGGVGYEDSDGYFHFQGRQFRDNNARSLETQWTFWDGPHGSNPNANDPFTRANDPNVLANGEGSVLMHIVPAQYTSNSDEVVRSVTATVNVRTPTSVMKIWEYGSALTLTPNQVLDVKVSTSDPFKSAVTPIPGLVTTITITGIPTGGTFTITVNGQTTTDIAFNAIASTVQTALEALSNVAPGDVVVTGGPGPGTPWSCAWSNAFALTAVTVSASGAGLSGGTLPAASATTVGTDYTVSAGSLVSVTLMATSGQVVTLRLIAGARGATVLGATSNGIQLRAVSLPVTSTLPIASTVDTSLAAARSRPKDLALSFWPEMTPNQALDLVNSMALRYQRERHQISFSVQNIDADHMYAILNVRISDRIRFVNTAAGLNETYWVETIRHVIAPGGGNHIMTLGCERVFDLSGGKYGSARYGFDVYGE